MKHTSIALALASTLALVSLVGCEKQDGVPDEVYKGVPTNGQSCKQFYKLPVNQARCIQQDGRGGK